MSQRAKKNCRDQDYRLYTRPTQSIIYMPLLVCVFQKSSLLIVQYNFEYVKCCSKDFTLQNLILSTGLCSTGFIPQHCWVVDFHLINMIRWKCFVPGLYQLRKGKSAGLALTYFYTIHRVGRTRMKGSSCLQSNTCSMPGIGWGASQILNFWSPQGRVSGVWPRIHSDFFRCVFGCQWWTVESASAAWLVPYPSLLQILAMNKNCFCYCSSRNN